MKRSNLILIILVIFVLVILFIFFKPNEPFLSDNPSDWITDKTGVSKINVYQASKGQAADSDNDLRFYVGDTLTTFRYEGYYKGNYFLKEYSDNGKVLMRIGSELNPNDGILNGLIFERIIEGEHQVLIFLDEDWKGSLPFTNILWGRNLDRSRQFNFKEVNSGIYMDIIIDDPSRFSSDYLISYAPIIVGDLTVRDARANVKEGKTMILFQ